MNFRRWGQAWIVFGVTSVVVLAEPNTEPPPSEASPNIALPSAFPSVTAFAQAHHLVLNKIDPPLRRAANPGDLAVLLVSLFDGAKEKQWLVELEVVPLSQGDRATKAPPKMVLYVSTGNRLEFSYAPVAVQVRTHGPFSVSQSDNAAVTTKSGHSLVNAEHLALGFDTACAALLRIGEIKRQTKDVSRFGLSFGGSPFPLETIEKTKAQASEFGLTAAEEHALAGAGPALIGFFEVAQQVPGLNEILWEVIDLPSAWSLLKKGGRVDPYFAIDGGRAQVLERSGEQPARYLLPVVLTLNQQPAVNARMIVTAPKPPLLTTAGITALFANHPKKPAKHAIIQVLSAQQGEEKAGGSP